MKTLIGSFIVALSMYSVIPMPKVKWNEKNMRWALAFFPVVGVLCGLVVYFWAVLSRKLYLNAVLFAALATALPVLLTGGIHVDGYCDTCDAIFSRRDREEKLRILKDSSSGAFAVAGCVLLLLIQFASWAQIYDAKAAVMVPAFGFVLSRAFSGLSVVTFRRAGTSVLAKTFADSASKSTALVLGGEIILIGCLMAFLYPISGAASFVAVCLVYIYYYFMSKRQFGGITGDLAGYFLELAETSVLLVTAVLGGISG